MNPLAQWVIGSLLAIFLPTLSMLVYRVLRSLDELAHTVAQHDRQLAGLRDAKIIERVQAQGTSITELATAAKYQEQASRDLVAGLRSLTGDVAAVIAEVRTLTGLISNRAIRELREEGEPKDG